jgi:hypothetical protein
MDMIQKNEKILNLKQKKEIFFMYYLEEWTCIIILKRLVRAFQRLIDQL